MTDINQFCPGALVRSRERDWVVVPQEEDQVIRFLKQGTQTIEAALVNISKMIKGASI